MVGLDGKGLRMLTHEAFTGMFGLDATLDESGNLWFLYRGETSAIMRLDTRNDQMKMVAQVDGAVWTARSSREDTPIPMDARVRVERIEGVKLIVSPLNAPAVGQP